VESSTASGQLEVAFSIDLAPRGERPRVGSDRR
jgi:hypothetical protein